MREVLIRVDTTSKSLVTVPPFTASPASLFGLLPEGVIVFLLWAGEPDRGLPVPASDDLNEQKAMGLEPFDYVDGAIK
jgi:hypothetical protein